MKHIISFGVGVQSSTLLFMSDIGMITPMPVIAINADTKDEPESVYRYLEYVKTKTSIPISVVGKTLPLSSLATTVRTSKKTGENYLKHLVPVFMRRASGKRGMMQRQCTLDTKISPIQNHIRDFIVGRKALRDWRKKHKDSIARFNAAKELKEFDFNSWNKMQMDALACVWIGISTDEADRAKDSLIPWIKNRFPLLELNMSRQDCLDWCEENGFERPPKSSCSFCPYHSDAEWIRLKNEEPKEFEKAVEFEKRYQISVSKVRRLDGIPFLHNSLVPLSEVKFNQDAKPAEIQSPCQGMCGL